MELSRGLCFCCDSDKVILHFEYRKVRKIICSLFSNDLMNVEELDNVLSSLKICPFCYHKLLILWRTNKKLCSISKTKNSKCLMCREGDVLFLISKWPHFKTIFEDVELENKDKYQICSECLFYLDVRYTFKKTILNKYPELKPKPKLKLKIQKVVPSPSILKVENGKSSKKYKRLRFSDVDESIDIPISTPVIDFSAIQDFKPLKRGRSMKKSNFLNNDPKFIDQIPYVLLKVTNLTPNRENVIMIQSDTEDEVITTSSPTKGLKIKFKTKRKKSTKQLSNESIEINSKPEIVETVLQKCDFRKDLIINLPKIPETINNKYDIHDSVRSTKKNTSNNKSTDDSTVLTNNSQLISDKNAKERFPESSGEKKEHFKNKDTVKGESEKLNLSLDHESEEEKPKRKKYRPKPLSKQKNKNAELPEDSVNQAKKDECCEDLEKPNIEQPIEIRNNVDDPGNENLKQTTDDSENTENMGEQKDSSNSDTEEIVDRSSESTQNANEDLDDKNDGIEENDKETQESLSMDEDNKDEDNKNESETEKTPSNNASIDDKESETDITPEENKDESETEKTSNNASIDDKESETDITPEETVDNGDVDDNRKDIEDNGEGVDDNSTDFEDNKIPAEDEKLGDHNSEEAENSDEVSDDENKEQEAIDNEKPIKEQNNTSSNTDQQDTVESETDNEVLDDNSDDIKISDVDKENIKDIISLLGTNDDKVSDTEEKESGNESENEASNNSGCKRKYDDDDDEEINTNGNAEKKKKKVTFKDV